MGLFELLLLSVGLAMDSFAVSICKGMSVPKVTMRERLLCGIWFGFFQGFMPLVGYLVGSRFEHLIRIVAPWVAFILLSLIGGNMIREAFSDEEDDTNDAFDVKTMFLMAIATSIDALAVGITFVAVPVTVLSASNFQNTLFAVITIGVITFVISCIGVSVGNVFGARYKAGSEVTGGTILIFIGLHSLIDSLDTSGAVTNTDTIFGMLIPLIGTILGAAYIYAKKHSLTDTLRAVMAGCAGGIMFSISVWGMIEPSMVGLGSRGFAAIMPVFISFCVGVGLQYLLDNLVPHTHAFVEITEGPKSDLTAETKMMLAEIIHHVPEGIALGAIYAGHFMETSWISASDAFILAAALAIQNFPEALFVSLPIRDKGNEAGKAFFMGVISGITVPLMGVVTLIIAVLFPEVLPYVMSVAGGAMIFATIEDIPQMIAGKDNDKAALAFVAGFSVVMLMFFVR